MKKNIFLCFLVLWGSVLLAQTNELVGTFSVQSYTGSDPSPTVTGNFNSTVGFLPQNVDTGDVLVVRQVFAGNHRRKLYTITGITGNNPLTLTLSLLNGTSGGPFPSGTHEISRLSPHGSLYDAPNISQELESYAINYTINNLESMDVDTVEERNDSLFIVLNNGDEFYVGPTAATAIDTSYQVGDSIYVVSAQDTIFTGIAYANPGIDTTIQIGDSIYIVTTENDTLFCGNIAQVVLSNAPPVNPATYAIHIDTLGIDTVWFDNDSTWVRFNVGGTQVGGPFFRTSDNFVTFTPVGIPPIGSFVWNTRTGSLFRKFAVTGYQVVSSHNGRNVTNGQRFSATGNLNNWQIGLNAAVNVNFAPGLNSTLNNPTDIDNPINISIGSLVTVCLNNYTGTGQYAVFGTRYRDANGLQLDSIYVFDDEALTLDFSYDQYDTERILRLVAPTPGAAGGGGTYTFSDSANGIDLAESSGTVTVAPDIVELTYAAVVGADSIMIWDNSANAHRRTSITEIVALASAGTITVTDQANGLDITLTGSDITIAPDITELTNTTVASGDSLMVWDESANAHRRVSAGSIAALASSGGVTGVTDQANGLDIFLSGGNVSIAHDFTEFATDPTYNGTEEFFFYDLIDGQYKKATTSWLSGGFMDLLTNQTALGVKKFGTGLQFGTGSLPTGSLFGAEQATNFFLKGGATMTDANYINASGFAIHTVISGSGGDNMTYFTATGNDAANDKGEFTFRTSGGGNAFINAFQVDSDGQLNMVRANQNGGVGASGGAGGDLNVGSFGIGFEGGYSNYRIYTPNNATQSLIVAEGTFPSDYLTSGQSGWVIASDSVIKYDITPLSFSKDQLRGFRGYSYKLDRSDSTQIGVIAQDFVADFPEALANPYADTLGIYPHSIAAIAYGAVGYLQEQLDEKKDSLTTEVIAADTLETYTLETSRITPINSSGSVSITVHPPVSPSEGDWFAVSDSRNTSATKNIIIDFTTAGQKYLGQTATNFTLSTNGQFARFTYVNSTVGWIKTN